VVIRGRKAHLVLPDKPALPALLVQPVLTAHKVRKDPLAPKVLSVNAARPALPARRVPWALRGRRGKPEDKAQRDPQVNAVQPDRKGQLAQLVLPDLLAQRVIRGHRPQFALSLGRTA
jgi:hypothetical protein